MVIRVNLPAAEKLTRSIIRDLLKYGSSFESLQVYEVCKCFTVRELREMWHEEMSKMEVL